MEGKVIGFVAFRKGSKRLPLKNGRLLGGLPLYQRALNKLSNLKQRGFIDEVVASTDCNEWQDTCRKVYKDEVVIHPRSEIISGDLINEGEVILDFFRQFPHLKGSAVLLLLCTYPFLDTDVLVEIIKTYHKTHSNVYALKETHHMPQKLLRINEEGQIRPYFQESMHNYEANTKKLKELYPSSWHSTGAFLIHDAYNVLSEDINLWNNDKLYWVEDRSFHIDIDTEEDFKLAEIYMEYLSIK